jgi:hypothetical protein
VEKLPAQRGIQADHATTYRWVQRFTPLLANAAPASLNATAPYGSSAKGAVEVERGADQRQVGKGLREVALLLAGTADLLGIQAQMIGVGQHLLKS